MAAIDSLPGDQRAVLQLVLGRGRTYDEIAGLLSIDPGAIRERARAAADALAPPTRVPEVNRQMICDYLLGQLPDHDVPAVRELLADSAPERGWAQALARELAPMSAGRLPGIPTSMAPPAAPSSATPPPIAAPVAPAPVPHAAPVAPTPPPAPDTTPIALTDAGGEPAPRAARRRGRRRDRAAGPPKVAKPTRAQRRAAASADQAERARSSRRGGMVVIAVSVIVVAAVIVAVARHHHHSGAATASAHVTATNPASASQTSSTTTSAGAAANPAGTKVIAQVNLSPASAGSKAAAIADVLQAGSEREVAIVGQNVPANTAHDSYEVWLYNSPSSAVSLGFVDPGVSANGKLSAAGPLPSDASSYHKLIITTETVAKPKAPGPIVLSGTISGL